MPRSPTPARRKCFRSLAASSFPQFKPALADLAVEKLAPINAEMRRLMADPAHVDAILKDGAERASIIAGETMREVRAIVGFIG